MYLVASVRLSVRPSVCPSGCTQGTLCLSVCPSVRLSIRQSTLSRLSLPVWGVCLCVCNQSAYADNRADAVDRLLI